MEPLSRRLNDKLVKDQSIILEKDRLVKIFPNYEKLINDLKPET